MSETTPDTVPPEPSPSPAPSPAEQPPSPSPEQEPDGQPRDEQGRFKGAPEEKEDRRWARVTARMAHLARERDQFAARLAALEQGRAPGAAQPPLDPQLEQFIEQRAAERAEQQIVQSRVRAFHDQGAQRFPDWQQRCSDLQAMGADAQFAQLLVKMPDGARVAGSLRDDPEEVERIASLPAEDRAFALGQYAARLEAQPTRQVSRAPAPPRPLPGRSAPTPDVYRMEANELARLWMKQALDAQTRR